MYTSCTAVLGMVELGRGATVLWTVLRAVALLLLVELETCIVLAATLTVRNDLPRFDASGEIVDAHSGSLVQHPNGTFFFYGERYRNATGMDYNWTTGGYAPKLTVYTSVDLHTWHDHGLVFPEQPAAQWCPSVVYAGGQFIAWWAGFNSASSR